MTTVAWVRWRPGQMTITWGMREARFDGDDADDLLETFDAHEQSAMRAGREVRCHLEESWLRGMAWEQLPYPDAKAGE